MMPGKFRCGACGKALRLRHVSGVLNYPTNGPIAPLPKCACGGTVMPNDEDARKLIAEASWAAADIAAGEADDAAGDR